MMATDEIIPEFKEIGARLEIIRAVLSAEKKLSQAEFCALCGLEPNAYSQWKKGRSRPSIDHAMQICRATGATLDYIYRGDPTALPAKYHRPAVKAQSTS